MEFRTLKLSELTPAAYNPRKDLTPEDAEFQKLVRSMEEFGVVEPIIWNKRTGHIVGGHQRLKAMLALGKTEETVVVIDCDLHDEKILNVTLNRAKGRWDDEKLAELLRELDAAGAGKVKITGFEDWEMQGIIDRLDKLTGILEYEPQAGTEGEEEAGTEPETFSMAFQIPSEYEEEVTLFMDTAEAPEAELTAAIVNMIKLGGIGHGNHQKENR